MPPAEGGGMEIKMNKYLYYRKKYGHIIICMLLSITIFLCSTIKAFATVGGENAQSDNDSTKEVIYDGGDTKIIYYEDEKRNKIFLQYVNGVLDQKNTILNDCNDIIRREVYTAGDTVREHSVQIDYIHINDFIETVNIDENTNISPLATLGTIKYSSTSTGSNKKTYYGIKCTYTSTVGNGTYTIKSFAGKVVDLVTLLVGAISLPKSLAGTFVKRVCVAAGITITGGIIKSKLSTTVACKTTKYKWKLVDTTKTSHNKNVYGYKYVVTDSKYHTGETYYSGYKISDWKKRSLAVNLHHEMFSYSTFTVEGWS